MVSAFIWSTFSFKCYCRIGEEEHQAVGLIPGKSAAKKAAVLRWCHVYANRGEMEFRLDSRTVCSLIIHFTFVIQFINCGILGIRIRCLNPERARTQVFLLIVIREILYETWLSAWSLFNPIQTLSRAIAMIKLRMRQQEQTVRFHSIVFFCYAMRTLKAYAYFLLLVEIVIGV